jgi:phage gpG-like protein
MHYPAEFHSTPTERSPQWRSKTEFRASNEADLNSIAQAVVTQVERDFADLDFTKLFEQFLKELEDIHKANFAAEQSPGGEPWAKLSPITIRRKGHARILIDKDRLRSSLIGKTGDSLRDIVRIDRAIGLTFGTDVEYSTFHTTGTRRMPQREHVGINEEILDRFCERIADEAVKQLSR